MLHELLSSLVHAYVLDEGVKAPERCSPGAAWMSRRQLSDVMTFD